MKNYGLSFLAVIVLFSPVGLWACDCGRDDSVPAIVHFKNGLTPNGPVPDMCGCGGANPEVYSDSFQYRDYGPARVVAAPAPPPKRPNS